MTLRARCKMLDADMEVLAGYKYGGRDQVVFGPDALYKFAKLLNARIKDHRQNVVVVVGSTGSGKSTFAIQLAKQMNPKWSLADNYIYGVGDLKRKLENPNADPISLFDEGSVALNSNNSMKSDDKMMVVLFDTMRSRGWTSIICIPALEMLNKRVREEHANFLCICPSRAIVRGYEPRGFVQIFEHVQLDWSKDFWKLRLTTIYPKLTPKQQGEYDEIKTRHQAELIQRFIEREDNE